MGEEERGRTGKQQIWQEMDVEKERWICGGGGEEEEDEGGINIVWQVLLLGKGKGFPTQPPIHVLHCHSQSCTHRRVLFYSAYCSIV